MPAKSRKKRGKNLPPSKRIKAGTASSSVTVAESSAETAEPTPVRVKPAASRKVPVQEIETVASYPYIKPELYTIGILAAIMLVLLVILGVVL
jgi:hypothetical protein